jgi:GNAT superfamily N-acetyltransferase
MAALVLTDLETPIRANPEVEIRDVTPDELRAAIPILARAYGLPEDLTQLFADAYAQNQDKVRARSYLAYLAGEPVSWAFLVYIPDRPIALLGGAGTLPEHRGKGIYTSLVARRLADARADGIEAAVLQAVQSTSAPICRKLGFRDIGVMDFYGWLPEGVAGH